jgi:L-ornithine Nalpha-acyltransferase
VNLDPQTSINDTLGIRQADSEEEMRVAQHLRYRIFHNEMGAQADALTQASKRDSDRFDAICDHLLVTRHRTEQSDPSLCINSQEIVGTYRLLRQVVANQHGGFYSQGEFDVDSLLHRKSNLSFLELGRSCVLPAYRGTSVIELLWQGIWNYVRQHRLDVMFGCASFEGTDPNAHADALSLLGHKCVATDEWRVRAHDTLYVEMKRKELGSLDQRRAMRDLPPLIKGYLRLGCSIGEGAVIDHKFNTTDVLIILPVSKINPRYFAHFGAPTS